MPSGLIKKYKEKQALSRLKRKDKEVFISAYDKYGSEINRFIYYKVGKREEANDLTSQVFLKTWEHIQNKSLIKTNTIRALFYRIARNIVIDYYRQKSSETSEEISLDSDDNHIDIEDMASGENSSIDSIDRKSERELIESKLYFLKEDYREIIVMRFVNDLSPDEIAEISGKSKGNVRVLIHRSLKALRDLVSDEMKEKEDRLNKESEADTEKNKENDKEDDKGKNKKNNS
ncbi:MAG: RNA polymerase sigma factor [Patescibacteria group bacterium]|jgi:RNA polymerase sigma-70 factor (ECF subfamily)|nr:RNA polymerase sigma factor [Patescibacteria group bacterium]